MLSDTTLADDFDMSALVRKTDGLSGSDLKELCRNAAMVPVREYVRKHGESGSKEEFEKIMADGIVIRPLILSDFLVAEGSVPNGHVQEVEELEQDTLD